MSRDHSVVNLESLKGLGSSIVESLLSTFKSVFETSRAFVEQLPPSFVIVPFGQVQTDIVLFSLVYILLGIIYISLSLRRSTRQSLVYATTIRRKVRVHCSPSSNANNTLSSRQKQNQRDEFDPTTVGGFKEEVYEFMDTCADVKIHLRKVEDPDKARAMKLKQLKEQEGGTDREDSSQHDLVEMCLDVKKGLHKVQDPDEARKAKLRHLKEVEKSRSEREIVQQHQQVGLVRSWLQVK